MSADLLAAFGTDISEQDSKQQDQPTKVDQTKHQISDGDTWQPWPGPPRRAIEQEREVLWRSQDSGTDVLFDADEDDFGNFEQAGQDGQLSNSVTHKGVNLDTSADLLGLDDVDISTQGSASRISISAQPSESHVAEHSSLVDDDWGAFEDTQSPEFENHASDPDNKLVFGERKTLHRSNNSSLSRVSEHQIKSTAPVLHQHTISNDVDDWDDWDVTDSNNHVDTEAITGLTEKNQVTAPKKEERPTNVPPPAVLLNLLPKVFSVLSTKTSSSDLVAETGVQVVEAYRVCARLIAGRTLRWKRDTILAQSVRIGVAGRSGGMKLAALDKGESRKEDQEVEETLSTWSRLSLKLNAAMTKAKVQKPPLSLSSNIAVRTTTGPDVISATHPCPICGLRRNERINGIDVNILDTFGEFWEEHWGHRNCHDFWYRYNNLLDQR